LIVQDSGSELYGLPGFQQDKAGGNNDPGRFTNVDGGVDELLAIVFAELSANVKTKQGILGFLGCDVPKPLDPSVSLRDLGGNGVLRERQRVSEGIEGFDFEGNLGRRGNDQDIVGLNHDLSEARLRSQSVDNKRIRQRDLEGLRERGIPHVSPNPKRRVVPGGQHQGVARPEKCKGVGLVR
jgi:hypothetical protein